LFPFNNFQLWKNKEDVPWSLGDMEFLFLVLKYKLFLGWEQRTSEIFFNTRRYHISKQPCNVLLFHYINTNERLDHFTCIAKGTIHHVTIPTVIFSLVKMPCFLVKAHKVFHWCLYTNRLKSISLLITLHFQLWISRI